MSFKSIVKQENADCVDNKTTILNNCKFRNMALSLWIIVLIGFVNKIKCQYVPGPKLVSKQGAVKECETRGKQLASYKDIKANMKSSDYLSQMEDGESAWIDGYAELSPFVAWHGCFNFTKNWLKFISESIKGKSVFACIDWCKRYSETKYVYVGVKVTSCYCITYNQRKDLIRGTAVNDNFCSISCEYNMVDSCGGQSYISVYVILEERVSRTRWLVKDYSQRPCVYVQNNQSSYVAFTTSCHTTGDATVSGYICTLSLYSKFNSSVCSETNVSKRYCIVKDTLSRHEALESCRDRNGVLADLTAVQRIQRYLVNKNQTYWVSVYRTFAFFDIRRPASVCTTAIKANDNLYLEPDDCNRQKHVLCREKTKLSSTRIAISANPIDSNTTGVQSLISYLVY